MSLSYIQKKMTKYGYTLLLIILALFGCSVYATTQRASIHNNGTQGNFFSVKPNISSGGRYVSFHSFASTLIDGDTNGTYDIFVYDTLLHTNERVNLTHTGLQMVGGQAIYSIMSPDGRYVAYLSTSTTHVTGDTNSTDDVFLYDRQTGLTERVNVSSTGLQANASSNRNTPFAMSPDARFIVFWSTATNLVPNDTNGLSDMFVRDRQLGTTTRVTVTSTGAQATGGMTTRNPAISADGRYIAYDSQHTNLVTGDTNNKRDVFLYDQQTASVKRVSESSTGRQSTSDSYSPVLSQDGRYLFFVSEGPLLTGDITTAYNIYMYDIQTAGLEKISKSYTGGAINGGSTSPSVSADGRYVAFMATWNAANIVSGFQSTTVNGFVHDRLTNTNQLISSSYTGGNLNTDILSISLSADGHYIAFETNATNIVTGDTNGIADIFYTTVRYCGDGTVDADLAEACDDGNELSGDGCSNVCALESPSCTITANPVNGTTPLPVSVIGTGIGGHFSHIQWDAVTTVSDNTWTGIVQTGYTFATAGSFVITGTVTNPYSGNMIASCYTEVAASMGGGGPARVIPKDDCPDGDFSSTPYDTLCSASNHAGGMSNSPSTGTTGSVTTGFIAPEGPQTVTKPTAPFIPLFPALPVFHGTTADLYAWAYSHGVTTLPFASARPHDTVLRYEAAKMLVQFAENVMQTRIEHNPLCMAEQYDDYPSFDAEMKEHITKACDLGLMGWSIRNEMILDVFRPFDTLSVEELNIIIARYLGTDERVINSNARVDIRRFLMETY